MRSRARKSYHLKDEDEPPSGGGRNPAVDFYGEKRCCDTQESKTDLDAPGGSQRIMLSADKDYDTKSFVEEISEIKITPYVAQNDTNR